MNISRRNIEIKHHAFVQAMRRGIHPDMIEATLKSGRIERFGKNRIRFVMKYKNFTVVCVDEIAGNKIRIVTIEKRR